MSDLNPSQSPTPAPNKLRALAATARVANIPSVVSNTFLGLLAGYYIWPPKPQSLLLLGLISPILLYVAGNFLNDWCDRTWDQRHRPERALPRGLFKPISYLIAASSLILAALISSYTISVDSVVVAAFITASIFIYTWSHKKSSWSVIPMGLCRGFLPIYGYTIFRPITTTPDIPILISIGLFCYILGLSLSARTESIANPSKFYVMASRLFFLVPPSLILAYYGSNTSIPFHYALLGSVPFIGWILLCLTKFRSPVPRHVSNLLAGIPFIDWLVLLPMGLLYLISGDSFGLTFILVPPIAVVLGKALQRYAPAT